MRFITNFITYWACILLFNANIGSPVAGHVVNRKDSLLRTTAVRHWPAFTSVLTVSVHSAAQDKTYTGYLDSLGLGVRASYDVSRHSKLVRRSRADACSAEVCSQFFGTGVTQRDSLAANISDSEHDHFRMIFGRQMTLPPDNGVQADMDMYMITETDPKKVNTSVILWNNVNGNNCNNAQFSLLADKAMSLNLRFLVGCTGMVIMSRKAVYIAHYWENIAFMQDDKTPVPWKNGRGQLSQQLAFDQTVVRGLRRGINPPGLKRPLQDSLMLNADAIDDDTIVAYLMIPDTGHGATDAEMVPDPYRVWWEKIKREVGRILPRLDPTLHPDKWHEYAYHPLQDEEKQQDPQILRKVARSRLLYKYDPNHDGKKKVMLITESTVQTDNSWEWS
jgi:hypothetical protein